MFHYCRRFVGHRLKIYYGDIFKGYILILIQCYMYAQIDMHVDIKLDT